MTPESEIREAVAEIMAGAEFRADGTTWLTLLDRVVDDFMNWVFDTWNLGDPTPVQRQVISALLVVGVILLLILAVFLALRVRSVIRRRRMAIHEDIGVSPAEWAARYDAALAQGNWQEAFRCAWRRTVAELAQADRLVERRGLTTGEAVIEAGLTGPAFAAFTRRFEQAFYARKHATQDDIVQAGLWRDAISQEVGR